MIAATPVPSRHPDIFTAIEAAAYLRLPEAMGSPEAAVRRLAELAREGHIKPLTWCRTHLWARPVLDAFIARETAALLSSFPCNEGNAAKPATIDPQPGVPS